MLAFLAKGFCATALRCNAAPVSGGGVDATLGSGQATTTLMGTAAMRGFAGNDSGGLRQQVAICSSVGVADDRLGRRKGAE